MEFFLRLILHLVNLPWTKNIYEMPKEEKCRRKIKLRN